MRRRKNTIREENRILDEEGIPYTNTNSKTKKKCWKTQESKWCKINAPWLIRYSKNVSTY